MRYVELEQGTEEWLKWRQNGIGGSDVAIISGTNPFQSKLNLWEQKNGMAPHVKPTPPMLYGKEQEPFALAWANENMSYRFAPGCFECEANPIFRASLDGITEDRDTVLEIKTPFSQKSVEKYRQGHSVPAYWMDQLQWNMMVTGATRGYLLIWDGVAKTGIIQETYICYMRQAELAHLAEMFWKSVVKGIPPDRCGLDYELSDDDALFGLLNDYAHLKGMSAELDKEMKELKDVIEKMADGKNIQCGQYSLTFAKGGSRYNTRQMELDGIDMDKYRTYTKGSMKINLGKGYKGSES